MASSMGLLSPVWNVLLSAASRMTASSSSPRTFTWRATEIWPTVSVPVLSLQRMSMLPKFSMAASRLTMTFFRAMRTAPRDSVTETIMGRSWGVSPTPRPAEPAHHRGALEHGRGRLLDGCSGGNRGIGVLLPREGLARQRRLVEEEIPAREQSAVARHEVPGREPDDVARHHLPCRNLLGPPVAQHGGALADAIAEPLGRQLRLVALAEVQDDAQQHHAGDDGRADHLAEGGRDRACDEKDQDQRVQQEGAEVAEGLEAPRRRGFVGPDPPETRERLLRREARGRAADVGQHGVRSGRPERLGNHPAPSSWAASWALAYRVSSSTTVTRTATPRLASRGTSTGT